MSDPKTSETHSLGDLRVAAEQAIVHLPALSAAISVARLFTPTGAAETMALIAADLKAQVFDATSEFGRDQIQKYKTKLVRSRTACERLRKEAIADWKKQIEAVNAVGDEIESAFKELEKVPNDLLESYKAIEKNRVAAHNEALAALRAAAVFNVVDPASAEIQARLDALPGLAERNWEEFTLTASEAWAGAKATLESMLAVAVKREADARELEELRKLKAEREAAEALRLRQEDERQRAEAAAEAVRIAAERAAEAARVKAEADAAAALAAAASAAREAEERAAQAERDRIAAEAAAEQARIAAEAKAKADAEAAAEAARIAQEAAVAEATRKATEAAAAAQAAALEAQRRELEAADGPRAPITEIYAGSASAEPPTDPAPAERWKESARISAECGGPPPRMPSPPDVARQRAVHTAASAAFAAHGLSDHHAKRVVQAIVAGKIPHVSITYGE